MSDGPAFPVIETFERLDNGNTMIWSLPGMSKREYFAAMAMQSFLNSDIPLGRLEVVAAEAVKASDALIAALEQSND